MKLTYIATLAAASILTVGGTSLFSNSAIASSFTSADSSVIVAGNPCASANPCAGSDSASNQFVTVGSGKKTEGTYRVIEEDGKQYIEFSEDFEVSEGPDLEIILHKDPTVESSIAEEDYISLAPIQSFTGTQRYEVPEDVDLNDYASVAVWCEDFNVTFGYAEL